MRRLAVFLVLLSLVPGVGLAKKPKLDKRSRVYATEDMEKVYDKIVAKAENLKFVVRGDSEDRRGNITIELYRTPSAGLKFFGAPDEAFEIRLERVEGGIRVSMTHPFFTKSGGSQTWKKAFQHVDEALEMTGTMPVLEE